MRAKAHSRVTRASPLPFRGLCLVHVALAVSRNPTAMVAIKPHSISWACQPRPLNGVGISAGQNIQMATEMSAHAQPAIYKGRKPRLRNAFKSGDDGVACLPDGVMDIFCTAFGSQKL